MLKLTPKHFELYNKIRRRGLSGGCSDLLPDEKACLSNAQWQELCYEYHEYNGDLEDYVLGDSNMADFTVVSLIENILIEFYKLKNAEER